MGTSISGSAVLSECGRYRYVLQRSLGSVLRWYRPMLFIMLNPSTADASVDDPTIRRCIWFAKREGATHLTVVNLFALRATDPQELQRASDPIGPENDRHIGEQVEKHNGRPIVAAWGAHKFARNRAAEVRLKFGPFLCLGMTVNNCPKHPLYLKSDTPLELLTCTGPAEGGR
jgi:hypothetical protein